MLKLKVSIYVAFVCDSSARIANGLCATLANVSQLSHHHHRDDRQIGTKLFDSVCFGQNLFQNFFFTYFYASHQMTQVQLWQMHLNYDTKTNFPTLFTSFKILVSLSTIKTQLAWHQSQLK